MKEDIKNKWVKALRSGTFNQTDSVLKNEFGYCCLGVLCELYIEETNNAKFKNDDELVSDNFFFKDSNTGVEEHEVLPRAVKEWSGIQTSCGEYGEVNGKRQELTQDNDKGKTFEQIADIIEKEWEKL